ncbi:conjugal transfer protein TraF [uncultured Endozoicomonas sp.]|uniref:conjugal transfer protein TraF n=1 Tax=uncultured Endozoicomonas sp. TaxID=432652 RepID=UPI002613CDAC|nr:conjugal transfer protein TraF [uncultured Endozoicomonas sp.]
MIGYEDGALCTDTSSPIFLLQGSQQINLQPDLEGNLLKLIRTILPVLLMPLASQVSAALYNAKTIGQGGAGVAVGDYTTFMTNVAHLAEFDEDDDIGFSLGFGLLLQDKDDMVDLADKAADAINDLEGSPNSTEQLELAKSSLQKLSNKTLSAKAGTGGYVAIPNSVMPASLFVDVELKMATSFIFDEDDLTDIDGASGGLDLDLLESEIIASAIMITEVGVAMANRVETPLPGQVNLGGAVKYQDVSLIDYREKVAAFDDGDLLDTETSDSSINLDLGASYQHNDWLSFGLTAKNLIAKTYKSSNSDTTYKVKPQLTAGVGARYGIATITADLQLAKNEGYGAVQETQYASLGVNLDFWENARLAAGFRQDLEDNDVNVMTVGIGISPWDIFGLDIAAMIGEDNAYGGIVRFTAKF